MKKMINETMVVRWKCRTRFQGFSLGTSVTYTHRQTHCTVGCYAMRKEREMINQKDCFELLHGKRILLVFCLITYQNYISYQKTKKKEKKNQEKGRNSLSTFDFDTRGTTLVKMAGRMFLLI